MSIARSYLSCRGPMAASDLRPGAVKLKMGCKLNMIVLCGEQNWSRTTVKFIFITLSHRTFLKQFFLFSSSLALLSSHPLNGENRYFRETLAPFWFKKSRKKNIFVFELGQRCLLCEVNYPIAINLNNKCFVIKWFYS